MNISSEQGLVKSSSSLRDRRGEERVTTAATAIARIPASPHRVKLIDISRSGCQIRLTDGIVVPVGSTVSLDFGPGRRLSGQVVWSGSRIAGVQFSRVLSGPLAAALGVEPGATVEVESEMAGPPAQTTRALIIPHWLRRLLKRAA